MSISPRRRVLRVRIRARLPFATFERVVGRLRTGLVERFRVRFAAFADRVIVYIVVLKIMSANPVSWIHNAIVLLDTCRSRSRSRSRSWGVEGQMEFLG